ncbi:MAG: SDR family NAD(P)-dependent oxidoreductase [Acidimicrobiia bacterium]
MTAITTHKIGSDVAKVASALLGRQTTPPCGAEAIAMLAGRRVLVTGAAGSIGSELVRQVHAAGAHVFLLDVDESRLHAVMLDISGSGLLDDDRVVLADIRDARRVRRVFADVKPDIVFHAAAQKHLPLLERYPCEGVKTNVIGTDLVLDAAVAAGVERFILVSTDKAADPTSVLGATKRLAECLVGSVPAGATKCASVRFGNVLGSRGSFLETLAHQINEGLPVTVTDPEVTRYFMTIPEAVGLVIEAAAMADHGEIYVLDMGEPVRIIDLVERYVTLAGADEPDVRFTGLRPGEKLHEALFGLGEDHRATAHPRISRTARVDAPRRLADLVDQLDMLARMEDDRRVMELLGAVMPSVTQPGTVAVAQAA